MDDGRQPDGGRTPDHGHPICSPREPNGSGKLTMAAVIVDKNKTTIQYEQRAH